MTGLDAAAVAAAAAVAGTMNAVVGAGTLITFPTLLALGYPPLVANMSNGIGLVPSSLAGAWGYRNRIRGTRVSLGWLVALAAVGGTCGASLLLAMPASTFAFVVPALLVASALLTAAQPRVAARIARRDAREVARAADGHVRPLTPGLALTVLLTGTYGGYFGAAQGVILLAALGTLLTPDLQIANGVKNVLAGVANLVSVVPFTIAGDVDWLVVAVVGAGSSLGGLLGARLGQRLPPGLLRVLIVTVALTAAALLVAR